MADGYGNIVAGSWRCHIAAWIVSSTDKTDTIRVQARFQAVNGWSFAVNGISGSVSCNGGSGSGTGNANIGANGESTIYSKDFTVSRGESAKTVTCKATVSQYYFNGGSSTASVNITIPRIPVLKPNPPKNATFSRVSDTQMKATWQGNWDNDAGKPWKQVIVDRRRCQNATNWGPWQNARVLDWSATNVTLTDAQPNGRYQIAIYARNAAGDSTHVDSQILYTTPAAPKSVTAVKNSETSITVKIDATNTFAQGSDIEVTSDGGQTWTSVKTGLQGTSSTWTDTNPPKGTVQYRVSVYDPTGKLHSPYALTNTVSTITTPLAPTITSPTSTIWITGKTVPIEWNLNHPDGTIQNAAQVEITMPGGSLQTKQINDATQNFGLAVTTSGSYKIRVRTKGFAADYGPWSQYVTIMVGTPPDITITSPIDSITGVPFTISWSVASASGVTMQNVVLRSEEIGGLTLAVENDQRSVVVPAKFWAPENGSTFDIEITVRDGIGLTSTETQMVAVTYTPPAKPSADMIDLDELSVAVTVHANLFEGEIGQEYWTTGLDDGTSVLADFYTIGLSDGTSILATLDEGWPMPETVSMIVERVNPDGSSVTIAEDLQDGQSAIDLLPPLRVTYQYRITAVAASGATASTLVDHHIDTGLLALNFGQDASETILVGGAWKISEHQQIAANEYHFADAQRLPVQYTMDSLDNELAISSSYLWMDGSLYRHIRELSRSYTACWLRNVDGTTMYASIDISQNIASSGKQVEFQATLHELEWREPIHG